MVLLCTNTSVVWSHLIIDVRPYRWERLFRCENRTRGCPGWNTRAMVPVPVLDSSLRSSVNTYLNYKLILRCYDTSHLILALRFPVGPNREKAAYNLFVFLYSSSCIPYASDNSVRYCLRQKELYTGSMALGQHDMGKKEKKQSDHQTTTKHPV